MKTLCDLPYDVLQHILANLGPVDVLNLIASSRKLYYPLVDDTTTWRPFCLPFGVHSNSLFSGRSYRMIYGRLLHKYGALLGRWCSDYPYSGRIMEFRLIPDIWYRKGETIIVGDVWQFANQTREALPAYPIYIQFVQIGFTPREESTPNPADDVQVSWHMRLKDTPQSLLRYEDASVWIRKGDDTPSLHVIAPSRQTIEHVSRFAQSFNHPQFPDPGSSVWLDKGRGVPRLPHESPPPILAPPFGEWYHPDDLRYVEGSSKPASIAIFPRNFAYPRSAVPTCYVHNPMHSLSRPYVRMIPRYYPLRTMLQEGMDPTLPDWKPDSLEGLWLGGYDAHGTECLFLDYHAPGATVRAWKITGDVNVPRGVCSWVANISQDVTPWVDPSSGRRHMRAYEGEGCIADRGFVDASMTPVRVIMSERDEILVEWSLFSLVARFIRYKKERAEF